MNEKIRQIVDDTLKKWRITSPPVQVEEIAKKEGLALVYKESENDKWSGMLYRKGKTGIIAVNDKHHLNRQRFTIAHELGHFFLSEDDTDVYVDNAVIRFRNETSSLGTDMEEIEANNFAAELLMPEDFIRKDIEEYKDEIDEWDVFELAQKYGVSEQAMTIRLVKLGYMQMH
ncbi:ImmA/IrrE family metallo-endopeptidase [Bacillaceae bacterium S4-13-58]